MRSTAGWGTNQAGCPRSVASRAHYPRHGEAGRGTHAQSPFHNVVKTKIFLATVTLCSGAWIGTALAQGAGGAGAGGAGSGASGGSTGTSGATTGSTGATPSSSATGTTTTAAPTGTAGTPTGRLSTPTGELGIPTGEVSTPTPGAITPQTGIVQPRSTLPTGVSTAPTQPGVSPISGLPTSQLPAVSAGTDPIGPNPGGAARRSGSTVTPPASTASRGAVVPSGAGSIPSTQPNQASRPNGINNTVPDPQDMLRANAPREMFVAAPPPAPIRESVTTAPSPNHVWVPGGYTPSASGWTWMSGTWQRPPIPGARWVPGSYDASTQRWTGGYWDTSQAATASGSDQR